MLSDVKNYTVLYIYAFKKYSMHSVVIKMDFPTLHTVAFHYLEKTLSKMVMIYYSRLNVLLYIELKCMQKTIDATVLAIRELFYQVLWHFYSLKGRRTVFSYCNELPDILKIKLTYTKKEA